MPILSLCSALLLSAFTSTDPDQAAGDNTVNTHTSPVDAIGTPGDRVDCLIAELHKPVSDYVMVVAHRGHHRHAPENSVLALTEAITLGVDMVEVDLRKTKDGVLILMHDETLDRTTNGKGRVEDHVWEDLKQLRLRSASGDVTGHRIPTFEEIMLIAKAQQRVLINVDKASELFREVGEVLRKTDTLPLAVVKSNLDPIAIESTMRHIGGAHLMPVFHVDRTQDPLKSVDTYIRHLSPKMMEVSFQEDTSLLIKRSEVLTGRGIKIWNTTTSPRWCGGHDDRLAVELDDPEASWGWLVSHGATMLMTDRPKELIEYLDVKGFRK